MKEFKHIVYDGRLEEFDQLVTDTSHLKWTPVPDCPSTIDPNVTVEDIVKACERSAEISRQQYIRYLESIGITDYEAHVKSLVTKYKDKIKELE